jgi:hypothetical protein
VAYLGHNANTNDINPQFRTLETDWKRVESKMHGAGQLATTADYKNLIKTVIPVMKKCNDEAFKSATIIESEDWANSILCSERNKGENMAIKTGLEWLIHYIRKDSRTIKIFKTQEGDQVIVQVKDSSSSVQYDYTGYLIDTMDKCGYFACDVLVMNDDEIQCIADSKQYQEIFPRG